MPSPDSRRLDGMDYLAGWRGRGAIYGLLALDLAALAWVILSSFLGYQPWQRYVDLGFGLALGAEFLMRLRASGRPWRELVHPAGLADLVAVASFLFAPLGPEWAFLRSLRTLRLLRATRVLTQLQRDLAAFRNPEAPIAAADLMVFVLIMTGIVYATQHDRNPEIANWADALYFTVTALTTTGFGDITLEGTSGKLLTVIIMLAGVTLFLRLAQALFRPHKVTFRCHSCGLGRHEPDAVHCKACGIILNIPDDGN